MDDDEDDEFGNAMRLGSETSESEKEFARCLEEIRAAEGLKFFADVYTKLYDAYYGVKADNDLKKEEIANLESKVATFDEAADGFSNQMSMANAEIERLKQELVKAKELCDAMHARELAAVESLETIKRNMRKVEKELEQRKKAGTEDEGATSAAKEKEKFEKEITKLTLEIERMQNKLKTTLEYQQELEKKNSFADMTISQLEETLEEAQNNAVRTNRLVEHLKTETEALEGHLVTKGKEVKTLSDKLAKAEKTLEKKEKAMLELQKKMEEAEEAVEAALARAKSFQDQLDRQKKVTAQAKETVLHLNKELKIRNDEATRLRNDIAKHLKSLQIEAQKFRNLEAAKAQCVSENEGLRQQTSVMEREIQLSNKQAEMDKREIENMMREKEILLKAMQKIQAEAQENVTMLQLQEQRRKNLEHEIDLNNAQITKQRLVIKGLEKEKDRMLEDAITLNGKIDELMEEVRIRTANIMDLQKILDEEQVNNKRLTMTLDAARAEKNMLQKNYTEALDEIADLKTKLKMLAYQIEQLKEDISGKETGLKSCESSLTKCQKRVEQLRMEIQNGVIRLSDARAEIQSLRQEEARMNKIIVEGDNARAKLNKELEGMMSERDVIGAQLVRRNDEISLLYEKIRILEITLQKGEKQYEQRMDDIRLLRLEILRLRKEKNLLTKSIDNMTNLRIEVFNLERELGKERLKVRALEESLETPLNVHRWRKLAGTDPATVLLQSKLRVLQKKVLVQNETIVEKDTQLKETTSLYNSVKTMLEMQPSPEIQAQLMKTQKALAGRTTKLKCLTAELGMREKQVAELRLEAARMEEELRCYKGRYFELKRLQDADEQRRVRAPSPVSPTLADADE